MVSMISKKEFEVEYYSKRKKITQIARERNISKDKLYVLFKRWGFELNKTPRKEVLVNLYINQSKSTKEIGSIFNRHHSTVSLWLKTYKVPTRSSAEIHYKSTRPLKEELENLYLIQKLSTRQVGKSLNVAKGTVLKLLRVYGIKVRDSATAKLEIKGTLLPAKNELLRDYDILSLFGIKG